MFPYPSGNGLHIGHIRNYTISDIIARFYRQQGYNVLFPIGWDAFGLPAEQYAIQTGNHPATFTNNNIQNFKNQLLRMGFSYDWSKEINTSVPAYYHWTQWIFKQIYLQKLAEYKEIPVYWCEKLGTVLANEEIKKRVAADFEYTFGQLGLNIEQAAQLTQEIFNHLLEPKRLDQIEAEVLQQFKGIKVDEKKSHWDFAWKIKR